MVADFEYNSGFELLAERFHTTRGKTESSPSMFSIACTLRLQNSTVQSSMEINTSAALEWWIEECRCVLLGTPLEERYSLVLSTHPFGDEAMEKSRSEGKYVN